MMVFIINNIINKGNKGNKGVSFIHSGGHKSFAFISARLRILLPTAFAVKPLPKSNISCRFSGDRLKFRVNLL